jgi:hypothetical protein
MCALSGKVVAKISAAVNAGKAVATNVVAADDAAIFATLLQVSNTVVTHDSLVVWACFAYRMNTLHFTAVVFILRHMFPHGPSHMLCRGQERSLPTPRFPQLREPRPMLTMMMQLQHLYIATDLCLNTLCFVVLMFMHA